RRRARRVRGRAADRSRPDRAADARGHGAYRRRRARGGAGDRTQRHLESRTFLRSRGTASGAARLDSAGSRMTQEGTVSPVVYGLASTSWGNEELGAIRRVLESGRLTMGESV